MPYIPHTESEVKDMLSAIGVKDIETLFDEIPAELRCDALQNVPSGINEIELNHLARAKANDIELGQCYIGAGAYEHHIPACVWDITSRGEFLTAYTPYQAEASQGTLQLLYEFQTMMAKLTAMDASNASLYDGASALAEAILMAVRVNKKSKSKRVLVVEGLHPHYQDTVETIVKTQGVELVITGADLSAYDGQDVTAVVVQQPNFFGCLTEVDAMTDWAKANNALMIGVVNPTSLALLKPPGEWGTQGADIVCGEGQPLGVPLASGGPYFGFLTCKQAYLRQMPGRIIGRTVDKEGKEGFALTLQAREQHIRRSKATSNICTNQGLLVTAATIYMSALGDEGLKAVAIDCHQKAKFLFDELTQIDGVEAAFEAPFFHEFAIKLPTSADAVLSAMHQQGIEAGLLLQPYYSDMTDTLLVCVTETKTKADLAHYVEQFKAAVSKGA